MAVGLLLCVPAIAQASAVGSLTFQGCLAESGAGGCASGNGLKAQHGVVLSPDGHFVYVVGKPGDTSGQIAVIKRDATTGAISNASCVSEVAADHCASGHGLNGAAGVAISPDGKNVYVASDASSAVVSFTRNASTGALTETGCLAQVAGDGCTQEAGLSRATGIAVSPSGTSVYVTSEASNAVVVLGRNTSTGALTWKSCIAEAGADGCAGAPGLNHAENPIVSPDNKNVYVTGFLGNSVVDFVRNTTTGALTEASCIAESGADGCRVGHGLDGADGISVSSSDSSLYVASEKSNAVVTFARSSSGALTERACAAESAGDTCTVTRGLSGAARVAVSGDGDNVYVAGYRGYTLVTFSRSSLGTLVPLSPCLSAAVNGDGCTVVRGLIAPAGLAVSPDGRNVYTGTAISNAVDSFVRQQP